MRPSVAWSTRAVHVKPATVRMAYNATFDEFCAQDVKKQYIAKACPSGVPSLQCIEGNTFDAPYEARTLKRQTQLRYRQLPVSVQVHNMYEARKNAIIACHGCSHEESRVIGMPLLANSMTLGQAEASRACNRYIVSSGPAEDMMCRSVENIAMKAINGSGVFSVACTDGQAKYEAYLNQTRGKAAEFRALQYSPAMAEGAKFAARQRAISRNHICVYEDGLYSNYPRMAGTMSTEFGYYTPFVQSPRQGYGGGGSSGMNGQLLTAQVAALATAAAAWFAAHSGGFGATTN